MKKFLTLLSFVFIVAGLIWSCYKFFTTSNEDPPQFANININLKPLSCDLNQVACTVNFDGVELKFELSPKPIYAMRPVTLKITNGAKLDLKTPELEIYGLNMDMGTIRAKFEKKGDDLVSLIVLSACVVDVMRYRFDVVDGGLKTGLYMDFDLKI
ncbi:MAG: hypothetical protein LUC34_03240 [Campylobacter sp.]|nr:hypothetical protein [Campylobacter sp.]